MSDTVLICKLTIPNSLLRRKKNTEFYRFFLFPIKLFLPLTIRSFDSQTRITKLMYIFKVFFRVRFPVAKGKQ